AGGQITVLEGDPSKPGPFVFRVKAPDGYKIPPHTHPKPERVTILSGSFHLGMGNKFDPKHAVELAPGTYGTWPAGMSCRFELLREQALAILAMSQRKSSARSAN
ncbi:MAG: cupin domain-containing protein, partial [Zavarzinella sp.]|nr:cupin domain-containing protein [Zavarzinella sp.]